MELGLLSQDTAFYWNGTPRAYKAWEQNLTLAQAFSRSCVPCYQELAGKIGVQRMHESLENLNLHNYMVFDSSSIENFWLIGDSKINLFEQIEFLKDLLEQRFELKKSTYQIVEEIMKISKNSSFELSGKTGMVVNENLKIGWFVGSVKTENGLYYFATRIEPTSFSNDSEFPKLRKQITLEAFKSLGIISIEQRK